jgi:hypothetical protein
MLGRVPSSHRARALAVAGAWLAFLAWRAGDSAWSLALEARGTWRRIRALDLGTSAEVRIERGMLGYGDAYRLAREHVPLEPATVLVLAPAQAEAPRTGRRAERAALDELLGAWASLLFPRRVQPLGTWSELRVPGPGEPFVLALAGADPPPGTALDARLELVEERAGHALWRARTSDP